MLDLRGHSADDVRPAEPSANAPSISPSGAPFCWKERDSCSLALAFRDHGG